MIPEIERDRWLKGRGSDENHRRCFLIHLYLHGIVSQTTVIRTCEQVIAELFPERVHRRSVDDGISIASFNDHAQTTYEDVCKVIEETNRRLEP